jgi:hypothetical protein
MHMRKFFLASFVMTAVLAMAANGFALERRAVADVATPQSWNAASTCDIAYYNRCTLWSWAWAPFSAGQRVGVCADRCVVGVVSQTSLRVFTGAPAGYGFTGTVSINNADANCCPTGAALASQPWLPTGNSTVLFDVHNWNVSAPATFCVVYTYGPNGSGGSNWATDHPAAGPTGPAACGFCYPTTRVNHTYFWGTAATPVCPGSVFNDTVCDAQTRLDIFMTQVIAVEPQTWGNIKNLYR